MAVPNTFANDTTPIPLADLDANFSYYDTAYSIVGTTVTFNGAITATTSVTTPFVTSAAATNLLLKSAGTTAVTINTSQNVGIGTASPAVKLDVAGNATIQNGVLTIGKDTVYDAFVNTPESMYFNVDSDGNSTGNRFVWGTDRAGTTGGTEWMRLDSFGNLGLGVTPSAWGSGIKAIQFGLGANVFGSTSSYNNTNIVSNMYYNSGGTAIYQGSDYASFYQQVSGQHKWFNAASGTAGNAITFTQAMTLDASGNLGIGVTSVASPSTSRRALQISNSTSGGIIYLSNDGTESNNPRIFGSGSTQYDLGFAAGSSTGIINWYTNGIERARIDSSGNLLVGTTSQGTIGSNSSFGAYSSGYIGVSSTGDSAFSRRSSDGAVITLRRDTTSVGAINVTTTSTAYVTSSDYRLKNTIAPMTGALAKVAQLKPVTYKWNADGSDGEGFIAHELAEVCPHAVSGQKDAVDADGNPKYQGIDTSFLVATLTAAIKEQQALIQSLTDRLTALEAK